MSNREETRKNRDIREWARSNGVPVKDTGRIPPEIRDAYENDVELLAEERAASAAAVSMLPGQVGAPSEETAPEAGWSDREVAPVEPRKRRRWLPERGTGGRHKRASVDNLGSFLWSGMAQVLGARGQVPVANVLMTQAPVAGAVLDDLVAGTLADKILQPFARAGDKGDALFALFGPPIMVAAVQNQPALYPVLFPYMVSAMESWYLIAGPKLRAAEKRREKIKAETNGVDLEALVASFFTGMTVQADASAAA